jgi:glucose/arabinose dehydrogenase
LEKEMMMQPDRNRTMMKVLRSHTFLVVMIGLLSLMLVAWWPGGHKAEASELLAVQDASTPEPFVPETEIIAANLRSPRQLIYDSDGTLYIAEAGLGGDSQLEVDPETIVSAGLTSRISAVTAAGDYSVVVPGLPSIQTRPGNSGFRGAQAIAMTDDAYWVGIGESPAGLFGLSLFRTVVEIDRETWRIGQMIDLASGATAIRQPDPDAISSDPVDLAVSDDGVLFIADAGCNCVWSWTPAVGLLPFATWDIDDNPVPTSLDFGPDGDLYVGFLSGFPFATEGSRIERWSPNGELVETYEGLTLVTDVLVDDEGVIYAVEHAAGFGDRGFIPDSGRVVIVTPGSGITPVLEGLRTPYGLAQGPAGRLVVSVATADASGTGMVIAVEGP